MTIKRNSFLDELGALADSKERQIQEDENRRTEDEKNRQAQRKAGALANLKERLWNTARAGKRKLNIFRSERGDFHNDLYTKIRPSGNAFCALRDKRITYDDVKENSMGAFREVYDELYKQGLEPKIEYQTDGGGMDEWFEIFITF